MNEEILSNVLIENGHGQILVCPICRSELAHFNGNPRIVIGSHNYNLHIPCRGENCNHEWEIVISDHKGNIFTSIEFENI